MADYGSLIISVQPAEDIECVWIVVAEITPGRYIAQNSCTKLIAVRGGPPGLNPGDILPEPGPDGTIPGDFLRLEQDDYESGIDPCAVTGDLTVVIYVYRSRDDLAYRISTSHGSISGGVGPDGENITPPVTETVDRVVQISSGMDTSATIQDQIHGNVEFSWSGPVLDENGDIMAEPPPITQSGSTLNFGDNRVLGTVQAKYQTTRTAHTLTMPRRDPADTDQDDKSTTYAATVTAVWGDGQYTTLEVKPPEMTGNCVWQVDPDDDDEEDLDCYRLIKVVDPCTGEVISERTERIACPEDKTDEESTDQGEYPEDYE